ncbi:cytochrome-c peroxidase [Sorangium sp. So ce1389]|uniref:cytochrome-c peroxidase n=1 Tax=Sorangium sp. So ce1389 TaxID=3133336 RepID=UPI003F637A08
MEAYEAREAGSALLRLEVHGQTTEVVSAAGEVATRTSRLVVGFLLAGMALSACGGESSDALIERQSQPLETPTEEVPEGECAEAEEFFPDPQQPKIPLGSIRVPEPSNLDEFVRDERVAVALGKALFWDMQVGSDGVQACASCHFRAGADPRSKNQLHPGNPQAENEVFTFGGPNYQLSASDFPLRKLADAEDRTSAVVHDRPEIVGSQGIASHTFVGTERGQSVDLGAARPDSVFHVGGVNVRRVEQRNTPTVINAVFNLRNFWDGRAQASFNGVNGWGDRDPDARVLRALTPDALEFVSVRLLDSSLASQAVEPPLSNREMSFFDRPFRDIGKKLVSAVPLAQQKVHPRDSALAPYVLDTRRPRAGLRLTYQQLIERAFRPRWWRSDKIVRVDAEGRPQIVTCPDRELASNEYTMTEFNFSLFFGLAVQAYEATLVSDQAPIDRFMAGETAAISAQAARGFELFEDKAGCMGCHSPPEFTGATVQKLAERCDDQAARTCEPIERMHTANCQIGLYDQGFYNIGVRPTAEDLGAGVNDRWGSPLSMAVLATEGRFGLGYPYAATPPNLVGGRPALEPAVAGERTIHRGVFKTPSLRNVELTAPYFHNGGQLTLRQVVEFYNRGGDFHERNNDMLDLGIGRRHLTPSEIDDIVAFLLTLTDERVRGQQAPFDHPQLFVPDGHVGDTAAVQPADGGTAEDVMLEIPAVGAEGGRLPRGFLE